MLLIFSLLASACSSKSSASNASGTGSQGQNQAASNAASNAALSPATKLAVGTLKLEGTDQAVTKDEAATLLTLWQAYQALSNSDTTAQVELDALVKQIQGAMTSDQTKAIGSMTLTRQSMNDVLQSLGMNFGPGGSAGAQATPAAGSSTTGSSRLSGNGSSSNGAGGPPGGGPGGGGPPAGGAPGDLGGVPGTGAGAQATPNATAQARMNSQATRVSPMLLQALITVLKSKGQ